MSSEYKFLKISLLGEYKVGKTKIRNRFMGRGFRTEHLMTIGADFATKDQILSNDEKVTFQIWDLASGRTFETVRSRFYRGSMGALLIFDLCIPSSFIGLTKWINELWKNSARGIIPIVILGNKQDLGCKKMVTTDKVTHYINAISDRTVKLKGYRVNYFETSAITGYNIENAFDCLGKTILGSLEKGELKLK